MADFKVADRVGTTHPFSLWQETDPTTGIPYVALAGSGSGGSGAAAVSAGPTLPTLVTLTIASGASMSSASADLAGTTPVAIWTPTAWTAASITMQASMDGTVWADMLNDMGAAVEIPSASIPTAAGVRVALNPRMFLGLNYIRLRSGTSAAPVDQAAGRAIIIACRPIL